MKRILLFIVALSFTSFASAQYIYNDFDANQNEEFSGWPNMPVIVSNPDASGVNTSANVAQFDRTDYAQWDHVYTTLSGKIDFATGTTFSVKVYSPIACEVVFKLEDKTNGGINTERSLNLVDPNEWVQLDFDFSGEASDTYDKIVIFFDIGTFNANTYYFDDVTGPEYDDGVEPVATLELPITFDVDTADYALIDFGGTFSEIIEDPDNSDNNIAKTIKQDNAEFWAGTTIGGTLGLATPLAFTPDSTVLTVKVWAPEVGLPIRLKAEDATNSGITVETEAVTTLANEWETLEFNFANPAPGTPAINFDNDYNKISIFFNFGTSGADAGEQTFFWDDVEGVFPGPAPTVGLPVTFDIDTIDYDLVDFGGNMSEIIEDPDNSDNNIVKTIKPDFAELWAGTTIAGTLGLIEPLPFQPDSTYMSVRVWSPEAGIPIRLKAENGSNGAVFVETEVLTELAMEWDTLMFNFANPAPGTPAIDFNQEYNVVSIFFNFGTTGAEAGEQTYYWDDVMWVGALPPKPLLALNVQDNFEDDGWGTIEEWFFQDPDLVELPTTTDPENSENTVADYNRSGAFPWTNAQFILDHRMDLSARNKFELDVYFPSSNDYSGDLNPTAAIKLQNSLMGGDAWMTQTEILVTVEDFDQWVTLLFDFSAVADSVNYDQVVVQMGGEGHNVPAQFYFDNLYLKHVPFIGIESPNGGEQIAQGQTYDITWDFGYWEGDADIKIIKEGEDPEDIALGISIADSTYEWTVFTDLEPGDDYRIIINSITDVDGVYPTDTSDAYFTIIEVDGVLAGFSGDPTQLLVGDSVTFEDMSLGEPDTWIWYFEGGTPETYEGQTPPAIMYENAGSYDVSLTVYNGGDENTMLKEDYITVGILEAGFEASDTQILAGEAIDFINLSLGENNTYMWTFEGGEPATSTEETPTGILYNEVGAFTVTLVATNEFGSDTLVMTEYITVIPVGIENTSLSEFNVYPNPANERVNISLSTDAMFDIHLLNINGQEIKAVTNQSGLVQINTSELINGFYFLVIRNIESNTITTKKLMIK